LAIQHTTDKPLLYSHNIAKTSIDQYVSETSVGMSESFEEELRKVCFSSPRPKSRANKAQLQLNLENAEKTYGKSSSRCRMIQIIIDDFTAKHQHSTNDSKQSSPTEESRQPGGLQLPFRPKTERS